MQAKLSEACTLPCYARSELFCNIVLHGETTQSPIAIMFCSLGLNFILCLHLLGYVKLNKFRPSSGSHQVTQARVHLH